MNLFSRESEQNNTSKGHFPEESAWILMTYYGSELFESQFSRFAYLVQPNEEECLGSLIYHNPGRNSLQLMI